MSESYQGDGEPRTDTIHIVVSYKETITSLHYRYGTVLAFHSIPYLLSTYPTDGDHLVPGFQPALGTVEHVPNSGTSSWLESLHYDI
jgi:hypothetical protein